MQLSDKIVVLPHAYGMVSHICGLRPLLTNTKVSKFFHFTTNFQKIFYFVYFHTIEGNGFIKELEKQ